jgi:hypothetical protein
MVPSSRPSASRVAFSSYAAVQAMPFARPPFSELLQAIDFAIVKDYPARGEYDGPL